MDKKPQAALRKRQQIADSGKSMFIFVVIASMLVGFAAVFSWNIFQQITFTAKVNSERSNTLSTIRDNQETIGTLKEEIQALQANSALNSVKAKSDDRAVQVILDALPADRNSDALGASLQQKLTEGVDGLSIEQLTVETTQNDSNPDEAVAEETVTEEDGVETAINTETPAQPLSFTMTVRGTADSLKQLLTNFNRSIRAIDVTGIQIQGSDSNQITVEISGVAYYQEATKIELTDKEVRP